MSVATKTRDLLIDMAANAADGGKIQVVTSSTPGAGWRAAALLSMAAASVGATEAYAGAVAEGRVTVRSVAGVVSDINSVMRSADYAERAAHRGDVYNVLQALERSLGRVERYEPKGQANAPAQTQTAAKSSDQGYSSPKDFLDDFGMND